jgi:hypothetical protein
MSQGRKEKGRPRIRWRNRIFVAVIEIGLKMGSRWIQKNSDWESEEVNNVKLNLYCYIYHYVTHYLKTLM